MSARWLLRSSESGKNFNKLQVIRSNWVDVDAEQAVSLLRGAFPSSTHADEAANALLGTSHHSFQAHAIEVKEAGDLVALAFAKRINFRCDSLEIPALTVGPVAVDSDFQGRGFGRLLMEGINELAHSIPVEAIYLQGIPNFYERFGYIPMTYKSKLRISLDSVDNDVGRVDVRPAASSDIPALSAIFSELTNRISGAACRNESHWNWLLGPAVRSWYFQSPQVVALNGELVGYFCIDRSNPERVREAVYRPDACSASALLCGVKKYLDGRDVSHVEVMTWRGSPLYQQSLFRTCAQFVEFAPHTGGQIIKLLNPEATVRAVLSARLNASSGGLAVTSCDDSLEIAFGPEKLRINSKSLMIWLLGVMPPEWLFNRGDIVLDPNARMPLSPAFSRLLQPLSTGVFVFQGDNL